MERLTQPLQEDGSYSAVCNATGDLIPLKSKVIAIVRGKTKDTNVSVYKRSLIDKILSRTPDIPKTEKIQMNMYCGCLDNITDSHIYIRIVDLDDECHIQIIPIRIRDIVVLIPYDSKFTTFELEINN